MKMKLLCGIVPTLFLTACGQPDPISYESLAWANNFYMAHSIASRSGWLFRGAKDYGGELRVGFLVPEPMNADPDNRRVILDRICPGKFEKIWQILPSRNKLVISVWTNDNKFKDSKKC